MSVRAPFCLHAVHRLIEDDMSSHTEKGGISYGGGAWFSVNFSWPFGTLTADADALVMRASIGRLWSRTFALERASILSIRRKRGIFHTGILIEHTKEDCPPYLVFWSLRYPVLKERLDALGYRVHES